MNQFSKSLCQQIRKGICNVSLLYIQICLCIACSVLIHYPVIANATYLSGWIVIIKKLRNFM